MEIHWFFSINPTAGGGAETWGGGGGLVYLLLASTSCFEIWPTFYTPWGLVASADSKWILTFSLFAVQWPSTNIAPTIGFSYSFIFVHFLHHRQGSLPSLNFIMRQLMRMFPMCFQCFHVSTGECHFSMFENSTTRHGSHDALQSAHVPNLLLCVAFSAPWFETQNRSFCEC